jgi:5-(carboxyamino)imidazole ribonucleotide synthase
MSFFSTDFRLGILGGGQLGKMLLYDTRKYDIQTFVLDPSDEAPARFACNKFYKGSLTDYETVYQFGKMCHIITIEIENVNLDALEKLEEEGHLVFPSPKTLRLIQNKGKQKDFLAKHKIPTSPHLRFVDLNDLKKALEKDELEFPFVWKSATGGYDGNGVKIVRSTMDLISLPDVECIAEEMVDFKNELAVIVAKSANGSVTNYPVVEMEFHPEANQVEYVICPARIPNKITNKAIEVALKTSEAFNHIGLLAVELFLTSDNKILVNEVAPRPHNSGHYSIEASYTSQFENHLRCVLGLPLGSPKSKLAGVMVNLVGEDGFSGQVIYENIDKIMAIEGVTPHIYGKKETRPFRKMGHVTIVNEEMDKARQIAEEVKKSIRVISVGK